MNPLNGLSNEFLEVCRKTGVVDLTRLTLEDVTIEIPGSNLEIDWEHLLYIKNYRGLGQKMATVVWTSTGGFFRTKLAPGQVVDRRAKTGVVCWLDMAVYKRQLQLTGTSTLYVMGGLMLVPVGIGEGSHYSWLNCRHIDSINETMHKGQSHVLFENGLSVVIKERTRHLKDNVQNAQLIYKNQQQHLKLMKEHHSKKTATSVYGVDADMRKALLRLHVSRDKELLRLGLEHEGCFLPDDKLERLTIAIRNGDRLDNIS